MSYTNLNKNSNINITQEDSLYEFGDEPLYKDCHLTQFNTKLTETLV